MQALVKAGITTFQKLRTFDPRRLESITGRKYPFGNQMKDALEALPSDMAIDLVASEGQQNGHKVYHLTLSRGSTNSSNHRHYGHLVRILTYSPYCYLCWFYYRICTALLRS